MWLRSAATVGFLTLQLRSRPDGHRSSCGAPPYETRGREGTSVCITTAILKEGKHHKGQVWKPC